MTDNPFKNELLKQNGKTAVDQEVSHLHAIIDAERRRVRRLTWLTIGVWAIWFLMISLSLVMPMLAYSAARSSGPPAMTQPAVTQPMPRHESSAASTVIGGIIGIGLIAAFLGLPVAGIVLAIMLIVSRRTASMNQVRASLAAIDAQLRLLGATGAPMKQDEK